jgi:hypothetical protein
MSAMISERLSRPAIALAIVAAIAGLAFIAVQGYLAPETMLYFLSFQWCS